MSENKKLRIDYDGKWKALIEAEFENFVLFFLPEWHDLIDFKAGVTFLQQELSEITATKHKKGELIKDNIAQLQLKSGAKNLLQIHTEVHSYGNLDFSEVMYQRFYRTYDKYKLPLTAIAIFVGQDIPVHCKAYHYQCGQTKLTYQYPVYIVKNKTAIGLQRKSANPFAIALLACLYIIKTKTRNKSKRHQFYKNRLHLKLELVAFIEKQAHKHNYTHETIVNVISFVINVMLLPEPLEQEFNTTIFTTYQKADKMTLTSLDKRFLDTITLVYYGETTDQILAKLRLEEQKRKTEIQKRKAEEQKRKVEEQKRKEVEIKFLEIEQKRKVEVEKRINIILNLYHQLNLNIEKIALFTGETQTFVQKVIDERSVDKK